MAECGQRARRPQEGQGLLGGLAQIEPGVQDHPVGGDAGGGGAGGPIG